ncbi:MAG TPA: proton-translocating NADH-quinone oxidoreductase subunit N [Verrucomicrobia subdivision 3 bacterium]|nr:proton-translocating NADH-quinone oxidoreductase subunit N [Limisphaerales bacterium]
MNASLISLEISVIGLGLVLMLADFFVPAERRRFIGYAAIAALGVLLVAGLSGNGSCSQFGTAFNGMFVNDALSLFFKRFFIVAAILVLFMAAEFSDRLAAGSIAEYYSLIVFALAGMLFAASSNDFTMLFVSIELITITFYVLVSFQRGKLQSLEAGVKYLILGALSSAFMVFGIALIWGTTGKLNFTELAAVAPQFADSKIFLLGVLFVLVGLGFKIAMFPFQIWAPDVYQGAPTPTTAFLAVGSKAAGFVLLLRVLFTAVPSVTHNWANLLIIISGITILYGNLCAIPQRNLKRLLGYSSIAHAGYLLLGVAALSASGQAAVLYYLAGYLFTVMAAFMVIALVLRHLATEDISGLAGLSQRSPLLAATMTIAMVSLAGIPPLAGFFGKFLLLKSVIETAQVTGNHGYYCLAFTALAGVIISLYYYFGVVRAIYWSKSATDLSPIELSAPAKVSIWVCIAGMFWLGLFPNMVLNFANEAAKVLGK